MEKRKPNGIILLHGKRKVKETMENIITATAIDTVPAVLLELFVIIGTKSKSNLIFLNDTSSLHFWFKGQ